jgi:hypothetical protein
VKLRLPRILADEDELDRTPDEGEVEEPEPQPGLRPLHWGWSAAVAACAAVPRLLYLFVFSDPQNPGDGVYTDVWHHWQIAYLTKDIGLTAPGGPRLWDLKGLDYFWGVLHPALMVVVFDVTGSIDIVLDRLVSTAFGVVAVVFLFHICRHYWGTSVAAAAALVTSLLPTSVMNDASGMLEPLGMAMCLAGILAWTRHRGFQSGAAFGIASMARAEAWIFGLGMVVAAQLGRVRSRQRAPMLAGFALVVGIYMLVLLNRTGNPIYPLWWNFLANAVGQWEVPVTSYQAAMRPALGAVLFVSVAGLAWTLVKRPPSYMLLTFGFGNWVFVAGLMGFTSYLADWSWWTPVGRHFEFPYVFLGMLVIVALLWWAPRRFGPWTVAPAWAAVAAGILATQLLWMPIHNAFSPTETTWRSAVADGGVLAHWYDQTPYLGHRIAVPPDRPDITYVLARFGGVEGKHLISEMYAPAQPDACWFAKTDVRLIAVDAAHSAMLEANPSWFTHLGTMDGAKWDVYSVNAPPCGAAG